MHAPLPAPLSPRDCDLRGYVFMPTYGTKLYGSTAYDMWLQNPRAGIAAGKLWWEAYARQCPAGSLPNDDAVLARLADFGTDLRAWRKCKEVALRGFILCSDGRLYHPLLCEEAIDAYEAKRKDRQRKRDKKAASQNNQPIENIENHPPFSDGTATEFRGHSNATVQDRTVQDINTEATHSTETVPPPARVAFLNVVQGSNAPTIEAAPADPPAPVNDRHLMPRAKDPPHVWIGSGLSRGPDGYPRTALEKMEPRLIAGKHGVNRVMVDDIARRICTAALIDPSWRGDWHILVNWLDEGLDAHHHILPAIRDVVERQQKGKGYRQPNTLRYFDAAIREFAARCRAA